MSLHVALDIGGTFTDLVAFDDTSNAWRHAKSSTTPEDLTLGIMRCLEKGEIDLAQCETFVHGATVAINTLIERTGARTALVATEGAGDAYLIGRGNRPEAFNVFFRRPVPLVSRSMIVEARERMSATGDVIRELTDAEIETICDKVAALDAEAVAVCLLHSYINPAHEQAIGRALRERFPTMFVSLSHDILRQYREYERTSTTVVNSYVGPRVSQYLKRLQSQLKERSFTGNLLIMQSNGGVSSVEAAARVPVALMESGPVGGINASAELGRSLDLPRLIAFDMGGTTAKASLIQDSKPSIAEGYFVGGYASGHPVMLPVVDIVEVGAGGGSIAWIDSVGALKVGPKSAGASPGPVCYGAGGTEPTVSDANLVLGRINGRAFLGGEMQLDVPASRRAIEEKIARPLGLTVEQAALGIVRIAISHMTLAVRGVSIERGHDPRDFVMVASGGNGGLHAPLIAQELSIPKVVIPNLPAHLSAAGMLMTDIRHDYVRTHPAQLDDADFRLVDEICHELEGEADLVLLSEGVLADSKRMELSLDLRYIGQEYYLNVPVERAEVLAEDRGAIRQKYDALHKRQYGQQGSTDAIEIVNIRVSAVGLRHKLTLHGDARDTGTPTPERRSIYLDDVGAPVDCAIYRRETLPSGHLVRGPAIIEEQATTTLVLAGYTASVCPSGEIIIEMGAA